MRYINNESDSFLVSGETGERLLDIQPGDVVTVVRRESVESYREANKTTVPLNKGRGFVKQFPDIAEKLCGRLGPSELWMLQRLLPFVGFNDGVLKHRNGVSLGWPDILDMCREKMGRDTCYRARQGLIERGVLAECRVKKGKKYIMNPYVCQAGTRANATLLTLFKNTEWAEGAQ